MAGDPGLTLAAACFTCRRHSALSKCYVAGSMASLASCAERSQANFPHDPNISQSSNCFGSQSLIACTASGKAPLVRAVLCSACMHTCKLIYSFESALWIDLQALSGSSNIIPSVVGFTSRPWTPEVHFCLQCRYDAFTLFTYASCLKVRHSLNNVMVQMHLSSYSDKLTLH